MNKDWCFTINNYTVEEFEQIKSINYVYIVIGQEIGKEGTSHLQGFVQFTCRKRLSTVKKIPGFERAHLEKRMGTPKEAADYCKKDGKYYEHGTMVTLKQGKRTDLEDIADIIKDGASIGEVIDQYPGQYIRYNKGIEKIYAHHLKESTKTFRKVETHVIWGKAGTGKTRSVYDKHPNVYRIQTSDTNGLWWDGYEGEDVILLDEFYGGIKYSNLLEVLDGYQCRLPIKGGFTYANWTKVYITSNKPPKDWYSAGLTDALARRITSVQEVTGNTMAVTVNNEETKDMLGNGALAAAPPPSVATLRAERYAAPSPPQARHVPPKNCHGCMYCEYDPITKEWLQCWF